MYAVRAITCFLLILFFFLPCEQTFASTFQNANHDFYKQAAKFKDTTEWETALKLWWQGRVQLEMQGMSDPRIGIGFIELATEKKAEKFYGSASDLYLWGFSQVDLGKHAKVVEEEVERILPLLDEETKKEWQGMLKEKNLAGFPQKIRRFWLEKDPTPTTLGNERLIEHWERIAFARKNYTKNRYGVYRSDDRGTIYVKYGEPERTKAGFMHAAAGSGEDYRPEFEIWLYYTLKEDETTTFFFANRDGGGAFRLMGGIEDALGKNGRGYELMNYAIVMNFDETFRKRFLVYESISQDYDRGKIRSERARDRQLRNIYQRNRARDHLEPNYKYAEIDKSDFDDLYAPISVTFQHFRYLDEENKQKLAILAYASPQFDAAHFAIDSTGGIRIPGHLLKQTLIVRDSSLNELARYEKSVIKNTGNLSIFTLEHAFKNTHYTVAAEAIELSNHKVFAIGKSFFEAPPVLISNPSVLEMSDLVLGVYMPEEPDAIEIPFPIIPIDQIWNRDPLQIYMEVYHLKPDEDGRTHFTVDFRVSELDTKGKVKKKEGQITQVFRFDSPTTTSKEHVGVDITSLEPGEYEVYIKVTDTVSLQAQSRRTRFRVIECESLR